MEKLQLTENVKPVRRSHFFNVKAALLISTLVLIYLFTQQALSLENHPLQRDHSHHRNYPGHYSKHHGNHHSGHHTGHQENSKGDGSKNYTCPGFLRQQAQILVSKDHLKSNIEHYFTAAPHLAGQNADLVTWTKEQFELSGLDASIDTYNIWLNYPLSHRVALLDSDGSVKHELKLEEPALDEDPTTAREDRVPTFHGYSASGNVTGELIYANLGRREDYDKLVEEGISLHDKVVLVRYGGNFRGLKVKFAEEMGAAAVLIYSDPKEDGGITEDNGYEAYPKGPARHPDAVQRGSVQDLSHAPGDPTTPGYPSLPDSNLNRTEPQGIPKIPSIPLSYSDALPLLKALNGHGSQFPGWEGALKGIEYNVGPSTLKVNVHSEQDYDFRPNFDIIARLEGESKEEVIIGNHRDSWIIGGADPNSGSAVLLEVARVFGVLAKSGWKPKRTIVFASWDGEEYGLLGSTEWGEDHADGLKKRAVAYVNCDVAVSGTQFGVSANPLLHSVIESAVNAVELHNSTLSKHWGGEVGSRISPLGSGSDYTVFQDHLGIPSLDTGFSAKKGDPVYQYHSNYDSLHWMEKFGDPELDYHEAVTKFIAVAALELSERDIIPFGVLDYAHSIKHSIKNLLGSYRGPAEEEVADLFSEVHRFLHNTRRYAKHMHRINRDIKKARRDRGIWNYFKWLKLMLQKSKINKTLMALDSHFLHDEGLDGRPWFKHIIYAPGRYTGYAGQVFPGIAESLEDNNEQRLIKWVTTITQALSAAANSLD